MAKNALTDYSTTAALNTDIGGISTEGTQTVNNWDNIVREQMKQLADHVAAPTFVGASMTFTSTDAGAASAPVINLYRDSASPAANDFIGNISYQGEDSAGNTQIYGEIAGQIVDPTSGSEDGRIQFYTTIAGSPALRATVGNGLYMASTAGDPGAGSVAAVSLLLNSTGTINFAAGDVVLTHGTNTLAFTGASSGYTYDAVNTVNRTSDGQGFTVTRSAGATGSMYVNTTAAWFGSLTNHPVYFYVNNGAQTVSITADTLIVGSATASWSLGSGTTDGVYGQTDGNLTASRDASAPLSLRRRSSDGSIAIFNRDTTTVGSISVTTTATAYNTSSDERLKVNFRDFDAGTIIDRVEMKEYERVEDGSTQLGPSAQELYEVMPAAVTPGHGAPGDEDYVPWMYDASKLVPVLMRELQAVRRRLDAIEAKP